MGIPPGYPSNKLSGASGITSFASSLTSINFSLELIPGSYIPSRDTEITEATEANIDSHIIGFLTGNILIPYIFNRYYSPHKINKITKIINLQWEKYLKNGLDNILFFSGDGDFIPILEQIYHYSQGEINIHIISNPSIAHDQLMSSFQFSDIKDVLSPSFIPPNERNLIIIDGNNFLNGLFSAGFIPHREDYLSTFEVLKTIHSLFGNKQ
jgi:hypothetical protein